MKRCYFILLGLWIILHDGFGQITAQEAIIQMRKGINLGNSLEAAGGETNWGNPVTQESFFDLYRDAGFQTVRIPVRWDERTDKNFPYSIQSSFLKRVEELVDWGLERDLWIVINAHHDDWIKNNYSDPAMRSRFDSIWSQVATYFAGKSEKLIFEILNEPHGLTKAQNDDMHARILSIIRKTNPTRLVIFQGHNWGGSSELIEADIPDPFDPYLIGSFHSYDPWPFGLEGTGSFGSSADINTLKNKFAGVKNWSEEHNIPVVLGEFGCHQAADFMSRMKHYQTYVELAHNYGFCFCAWDDGGDFRIMERQQGTWKVMKDILIYGHPNSPGYPKINIIQDTTIQLTWSNRIIDCDRILIQRGSTATNIKTIDTLHADETMFTDENLNPNQYYYYRIIADYTDSVQYYSHPVKIYLPYYVKPVRSPFSGFPATIPGIIEAEDFDNGGEGLAYHDLDPRNIPGEYREDVGVDIYDRLGEGYHIGNMLPGEWMEYSVNVSEADTFQLVAYLASPFYGGKFKVDVGNVHTGTLLAPNSSSWLTTDTVSTLMILDEGEQIMRFTMIDNPSFNFDKLEFLKYSYVSNDSTTLDTTGIINYREDMFTFNVYQDRSKNLHLSYNGPKQLKELRIYSVGGKVELILTDPTSGMEIPVQHLENEMVFIQGRSLNSIYYKKIFIY